MAKVARPLLFSHAGAWPECQTVAQRDVHCGSAKVAKAGQNMCLHFAHARQGGQSGQAVARTDSSFCQKPVPVTCVCSELPETV